MSNPRLGPIHAIAKNIYTNSPINIRFNYTEAMSLCDLQNNGLCS